MTRYLLVQAIRDKPHKTRMVAASMQEKAKESKGLQCGGEQNIKGAGGCFKKDFWARGVDSPSLTPSEDEEYETRTKGLG